METVSGRVNKCLWEFRGGAVLIISRLLKPEFVPTDLLLIVALQETRSRYCEELHVPGFLVYGKKFGLTTLLV